MRGFRATLVLDRLGSHLGLAGCAWSLSGNSWSTPWRYLPGSAGMDREGKIGPAPSDSDATRGLLELVGQGDRSALGRLLDQHRGSLRQMVELRLDRRIRQRLDPSDVVQEAQMEAASRITDYLRRRPMPFHLWLRRTAFEYLLRLHRRHVEAECRSVDLEVPLPESSSAMLARRILARDPQPAEQASQQELARQLRWALARLPELDREILLMRNFEGLSNAEIGLITNLEPGAVSKRHGRAILRLRKELTAEGRSEMTP
jgi:RNA polymerase sigma-70 factor (ECF subfamily)